MLTIKLLGEKDIPQIAPVFLEIFSGPPWNDDWSDEAQLAAYMRDLTCNPVDLCFGLFSDDALIGISLGHIRHWYEGTEYFIQEFGILPQYQRQGNGTAFLQMIRRELQHRKVKHILLLTEDDLPAYDFYRKNGFTRSPHNVAMFSAVESN